MSTADRDDLAAIGQQIITDYALDHESLHANWRCEHPDVYGPCGCVDEFLTSLAQMVLESDWLRDVKADAWEVGVSDASDYEHGMEGYLHGPDVHPPKLPTNPYRADRVDAEDFADELPAHIEESMKDPEYAAADALHREAEAAWKSWVPSMFADDENMHTAYVSGYKDRAPRVDAEDGGL